MENQLKKQIELLKEKAESISLLYVEDEQMLREKVTLFFSKIFQKIDTAANGKEGLEKFLDTPYDIIITDLLMPTMNGIEFIRNIREINEKQEIIVLSAYTDSEYLTQCIDFGVTGYIVKPIDFVQAIKVLDISIDRITALHENEMYKTKLESMVSERTQNVLRLQNELVENHAHVIHTLVKMIEGRDTYTGGHSERVATYSRAIAKAMGYEPKECDMIYQAGILHDIGKIITPDAILLKPGRLNEQEYALIKSHVSAGYEILSEVPMYSELAEIVYAHHEHYDGSGYPRALKGDDIPMPARIMVVADAFDAMTTTRIYKRKKTVAEAIVELKKFSALWYDPRVIEYAIPVLESVNLDEFINQDPDSRIDEERFAYFYKDPLTHLYNHSYFDFVLRKNMDEKKYVCLNMIYIKNFTAYNRRHGWSEGDDLLIDFGHYLQSEFPDAMIFRIFGDDFVVMQTAHQEIDIEKINLSPLLKNNDLICDYRHFDLTETVISSYKDLQDPSSQ